MKIIPHKLITEKLAALIDSCLKNVEDECVSKIALAEQSESCAPAKWALSQILANAAIAKETHSYACQDCGIAVVFARLGIDAKLEVPLEESINAAVTAGYKNARKSVADPLTRLNTETNAPAVIYIKTVPGDSLKLTYLAKGAGSENMSAIYMLTPSKGRQGIVGAVTDCVKRAGANPCPPIIVGVGVGGTMDKAAFLSKEALTRKTGAPSHDPDCAALEAEILKAINALGIGAQGLGGDNTALAVHVEKFPTHIGMLPVAVTIQCHSVRHGEVTL